MKRILLSLTLLFLVIVLPFALVGCGSGNNGAANNGRPNNGGGGGAPNNPVQTPVPDPSVPDPGITDGEAQTPDATQPEVDDEDIRGDAGTEGATAVITLQHTTATFIGEGVTVNQHKKYGTVIELTAKGTYVVQGTLTQGFIAVWHHVRHEDVTIVLNGVNIFARNYAAISSIRNSNVIIELAKGSTNYLTDGGEGVNGSGSYDSDYDPGMNAPNATLLVRRNLTIRGEGKLIVNGNANNGIGGRSNLTIEGGDIHSTAANNAIKGNDSITVTGGMFTLNSQQDGIKTDADSYLEDNLGDIKITGGYFEIVTDNDAIEAEKSLEISNASMKIRTAGGSSARAGSNSAKGLKARVDLTIYSGTFDIDSNDDAVHSNDTITINGGTLTIASGDDAIHADNHLTINDGIIAISKSYEGLESVNITINGGNIQVVASDDGINISAGSDGSSINRPGQPGRPGQGGGNFGVINGVLTINGGIVYVDSAGDGIDSNGNIVMNGGTVVVMGPTSSMDAAIDYNGTFKITGGTLIALGGSTQMAQQPGSSSTQYTFHASFTNAIAAGSVIRIETSGGQEIATVKAVKTTRSLVVSTPQLQRGMSYRIIVNGTVLKTFTINNVVSNV